MFFVILLGHGYFILRNPLQNYYFFFIPTRRHKKVAYLPKSRNCVNTGQTDLQKNAFFFIFFATPSVLSSFFAISGYLLCFLFMYPLIFGVFFALFA